MSRRTCFSAPATALARVFLPTVTPNRAGRILLPRFLAPRGGHDFVTISSVARPSSARQQGFCQPQEQQTRQGIRQRSARSRLISTSAVAAAAAGSSRGPVFRAGGGGGRGGGGSGSNSKAKGPLPRDKDIKHRYVLVRREDGSLSEPQPTAEVLASLNRHTESLVVLALPKTTEDGEEDDGNGPRFPICHIVDRIAERKAESDRAREQRKKAVSLKALELNWSIDSHDLDHRLAKLREFLDKGMRVEVTLLRKGKGRNKKQAATPEHAADVVRRIRAAVQAVPGAREVKAADGELLKTLRLLLEGPPKKAAEKKNKAEAEAEAGPDARGSGD